MQKPIHVLSEIGKLHTVILKRPGTELENLIPQMMKFLLFDDIPYLKIAQQEHDYFSETLNRLGTEVLNLDDLIAESLTQQNVKKDFIEQVIDESGFLHGPVHDALEQYLLSLETQKMVAKVMSGVRRNEVELKEVGLKELTEDTRFPFYMNPMTNLYFTRDPAAAIGEGISINNMTFAARKRESLFMEYIIAHHPRFANQGIRVWHNRAQATSIEGGDELVLSAQVLAIGVSQRTDASAIEKIAQNLFENSNFKSVLAIRIPHNHAMMHLDTVFTMINRDQFTVHPAILNKKGQIDSWVLHPKKGGGTSIEHHTNLKATLKKVLGLSEIDLIPTGGGDEIAAAREQWNDGTNTLAVAPGEVVTYDRNYISNKLLREHGILVHEIHSSELSRGRGGPRCMSMPIIREDL
ncbi:arginine deiminase [Liquorilactobacillus satsumensis]|uniref:Arginine deiminase n=1 Tax=Liquorilactobacillus satsumensis DSM 16230 = JCM 12392 TaxID=1423801 RepID=A0A0R1V3B4_9LACO|nr:arginine deiminase [Liquorilactobacillus satsumensis]KRM00088.1 arginine deiminase [Liquorilactobacillus satsumensis DSM 16230 = JCM 12392]MCC7667047.1 arginine deiminase [Liquorilactobacillus satsumensis]MCP9358112.1 arginine deiminase [Liquorilactobacillus satsumensis]MCP9372123.1 arginine deiminase [Liquorilactobacillus satsumensis]